MYRCPHKNLKNYTMSLKKYATSIPIITTLLLAIVSYIGVVYAINSAITGWSVAPSSITDITLIDTTCRRVTNNAVSTNNRYIPTTTMAEWNSFALAAPTH